MLRWCVAPISRLRYTAALLREVRGFWGRVTFAKCSTLAVLVIETWLARLFFYLSMLLGRTSEPFFDVSETISSGFFIMRRLVLGFKTRLELIGIPIPLLGLFCWKDPRELPNLSIVECSNLSIELILERKCWRSSEASLFLAPILLCLFDERLRGFDSFNFFILCCVAI